MKSQEDFTDQTTVSLQIRVERRVARNTEGSLNIQRRWTVKYPFLLLLAVCFSFSTTYGQKTVVKSGAALTAKAKVDSATVRQYQRILEDVCVQYSTIKRNLTAATQQKAAPAIKAVREYRRSHPRNPDILNVAGSEVRKVFGSRCEKVENVLVCYVLGDALQCADINLMRQERQDEIYQQDLNSAKPAVEQVREESQRIMEQIKKLQAERDSLAILCTRI
jgi:hypothetical protein